MKIAEMFCPNLIGDTVMATPTLRAFRRGFPGATIAGVSVKAGVTPTLEGTPWFDEADQARSHARTTAPERTVAGQSPPVPRRGHFDMAVLLPNSFRSALIAWLAGIPRRVGYVRYGRELSF